jgi:WD40 repeat protein
MKSVVRSSWALVYSLWASPVHIGSPQLEPGQAVGRRPPSSTLPSSHHPAPRRRRPRQEDMSSSGPAAAQHLPRREARDLAGHEGAVLAVRFNRDGNYCLSCGKDRTLRLWNPHTGALVKTYKSHAREVRDVHSSSYARTCPPCFLPLSRLTWSEFDSFLFLYLWLFGCL